MLDQFSRHHWREEYYPDGDGSMLTYNRLTTMRKILDEKYHGYLRNYVKAMVEYEIMNDVIEREKDLDAVEVALSFITDGWEQTSVRPGA